MRDEVRQAKNAKVLEEKRKAQETFAPFKANDVPLAVLEPRYHLMAVMDERRKQVLYLPSSAYPCAVLSARGSAGMKVPSRMCGGGGSLAAPESSKACQQPVDTHLDSSRLSNG